MNVLLIGGLGSIGRALAKQLLAEGDHRLVLVDSLTAQVHGPSTDQSDITSDTRVRFNHADTCPPGVLQDALAGIDPFDHFAAETSTGQSMIEIQTYSRTNVMGTAILLEAIVKQSAKQPRHLVLSSSRSVYGKGAYVVASQAGGAAAPRVFPDTRTVKDMAAGRFDCLVNGQPSVCDPTLKTDPTNPHSPYAASKLSQEDMCQIACAAVGVQFTALRFKNVYGPAQSLRNPDTGLLSIFSKILRKGRTIDIFDDGEESRDEIYVEDVVTALCVAPKQEQGSAHTATVGHGTRTGVSDLLALCETKLGVSARSRISGRFRAGDIRHCFADTARMRALFEMTLLTSLKDGLSAIVDWALPHLIERDRSEIANKDLRTFPMRQA